MESTGECGTGGRRFGIYGGMRYRRPAVWSLCGNIHTRRRHPFQEKTTPGRSGPLPPSFPGRNHSSRTHICRPLEILRPRFARDRHLRPQSVQYRPVYRFRSVFPDRMPRLYRSQKCYSVQSFSTKLTISAGLGRPLTFLLPASRRLKPPGRNYRD